jgi:hypothetical protein
MPRAYNCSAVASVRCFPVTRAISRSRHPLLTWLTPHSRGAAGRPRDSPHRRWLNPNSPPRLGRVRDWPHWSGACEGGCAGRRGSGGPGATKTQNWCTPGASTMHRVCAWCYSPPAWSTRSSRCRQGDCPPARTARAAGGVPAGANVLRPDACEQRLLRAEPRTQGRRHIRPVRRRRGPVGFVRRRGPPPARDGRANDRGRNPRAAPDATFTAAASATSTDKRRKTGSSNSSNALPTTTPERSRRPRTRSKPPSKPQSLSDMRATSSRPTASRPAG